MNCLIGKIYYHYIYYDKMLIFISMCIIYFVIDFVVSSQSNRIQNIKLKKPVSANDTMIKTNTIIFQSDLALSYNSFGFHTSLINKSCKFYENASYMQNEGYSEVKCHLHKNDV